MALAFTFGFMPAVNISVVAETTYSELDNFTMLTIPLFVLMGAAIGKSRAGLDLYSSLNRWLSRVPGGLGVLHLRDDGIAPDIPLRKIIWGVVPFLILMMIAIVLLCVMPGIAL